MDNFLWRSLEWFLQSTRTFKWSEARVQSCQALKLEVTVTVRHGWRSLAWNLRCIFLCSHWGSEPRLLLWSTTGQVSLWHNLERIGFRWKKTRPADDSDFMRWPGCSVWCKQKRWWSWAIFPWFEPQYAEIIWSYSCCYSDCYCYMIIDCDYHHH